MVLSEKTLYSLGRRCVYISNRRKAKKEIPDYLFDTMLAFRFQVFMKSGTPFFTLPINARLIPSLPDTVRESRAESTSSATPR